MQQQEIWAFVVALGASVLASTAHAEYGIAKGRIKYYEFEGGYCDNSPGGSGQACGSAAVYRHSHYQTTVGISEARVLIRDQDSNVIGTGSTDADGYYNIQWVRQGLPAQLRVAWYPEHKDGKFRLKSTTGTTYIFHSSSGVPPVYGGEADLGVKVWGSASSPNPLANVYGGASRMWSSLKDSTRMNSNYNNVEIRGLFAPNAVGPLGVACPTACSGFVGSQAYVHLTTAHPYDQQARILHEMGHIATQVARQHYLVSDYCYPDTRSPGTINCVNGMGVITGTVAHDVNTQEYRNDSFEEGTADFLANRAIYRAGAVEPTLCSSNVACNATDPIQQVESSSITGYFCAAGEGRWELSVARYLRDIHDNSNDNVNCTGDPTCQTGRAGNAYDDPMSRSLDEMINAFASYSAGTANHENNEGQTSRDGYSGEDYQWNYNNTSSVPVDTTIMRLGNCNP